MLDLEKIEVRGNKRSGIRKYTFFSSLRSHREHCEQSFANEDTLKLPLCNRSIMVRSICRLMQRKEVPLCSKEMYYITDV